MPAKVRLGLDPASNGTRPGLFEEDRAWLSVQPGMNPWQEGCDRLVEQLHGWLAEYVRALGLAVVTAAHPHAAGYLRRLWACWGYHWKIAAAEASGGIDGAEVAERLRGGLGWLGDGRLGGDVLRDVVLAEAMLRHDNAALDCFEREYRSYAIRIAGTVRPDLAACPDWWNELLDRLAGVSEPPGKLERFLGRAGLQNWLGTVVRRFLWDRSRRDPAEGERAEPVEELPAPAGRGQPAETLISDECLELFQGLLHGAFGRMQPRERLLLFLHYAEGLSGKEVAAILRIHPGNVSRSKERALEQLRTELLPEEAALAGRAGTYEECLQHLLGGSARRSFAGVLTEALRQATEAEVRA
jgi:RNA polymerase sigma factor (sigma-70 family)